MQMVANGAQRYVALEIINIGRRVNANGRQRGTGYVALEIINNVEEG